MSQAQYIYVLFHTAEVCAYKTQEIIHVFFCQNQHYKLNYHLVRKSAIEGINPKYQSWLSHGCNVDELNLLEDFCGNPLMKKYRILILLSVKELDLRHSYRKIIQDERKLLKPTHFHTIKVPSPKNMKKWSLHSKVRKPNIEY